MKRTFVIHDGLSFLLRLIPVALLASFALNTRFPEMGALALLPLPLALLAVAPLNLLLEVRDDGIVIRRLFSKRLVRFDDCARVRIDERNPPVEIKLMSGELFQFWPVRGDYARLREAFPRDFAARFFD